MVVSLISDGESNQTRHVAGEEVASTGLEVPFFVLVQKVKSGS